MQDAEGVFSPLDITNLKLWLDADDSPTIVPYLNGSDLTRWDDKSGLGNNILQSTAAEQPFYDTGAAGNGKDGVTFDRSTGENMDLPDLGLSSGNFTIFIAINMLGTENDQRLHHSNTGPFVPASFHTAGYGWYDGGWRTNGTVTTGEQFLTYILDSTSPDVRKNGTAIGGFTYTQNPL